MSENVAIIGASHKPERYAHKAQVMLTENGHRVFPVSGNGREILGVPGYRSVAEIDEALDTVTLYLNPQRHQAIVDDILRKKPRRVIFNPGTESDELERLYRDNGIETERACTLVLLSSGQF